MATVTRTTPAERAGHFESEAIPPLQSGDRLTVAEFDAATMPCRRKLGPNSWKGWFT